MPRRPGGRKVAGAFAFDGWQGRAYTVRAEATMGAAGIEIDGWLNRETVERAHARAQDAQRRRHQHVADTGMRAARARDPKLLRCLEKGAEILTAMQEEQVGRTRRTSSRYADTVELTEVALWRKAYEFADRGEPLAQLEWIYGAAAVLAGFVV